MTGSGGCARPSDEQQLRTALAAIEEALEAGNPVAVMDQVADDFTGSDGSLDRSSLHTLLRGQVLANAHIGVALGPIDVELQDDRALVRFSATFTGGAGRWLPERGSVYRITTGWRKESGRWLCVNAQWQRLL